MTQPSGSRTAPARDAERLKFFTDAVVAIALTLLILPLMEAVSAAAGESLDTAHLLREHGSEILSFFISFAVIAVFWTVHHRIYEHVRHYNGRLLWLNLLWMLTIVIMPVTTAMTGSMKTDALQAILYVGTMASNSLLLLAMSLVVHHDVGLADPGDPLRIGTIVATATMTVLFLVALVVSAIWPNIGYVSLFLMWLIPVVQRVVTPRVRRAGRI